MTSVQLHLAMTHVPVILSLVGLIMLLVALINKSTTLLKTSYLIIFIAGLTALPVYFSGEGAEEAVEKLPGVSDAIIEEHEDFAKYAMFSIAAAGLIALAALFLYRLQSAVKIFKSVILALALLSGGLMIQTAHLGGQVRHSEIRSAVSQQNNERGNENESKQQNANDDD